MRDHPDSKLFKDDMLHIILKYNIIYNITLWIKDLKLANTCLSIFSD